MSNLKNYLISEIKRYNFRRNNNKINPNISNELFEQIKFFFKITKD